MAPLSHAVHSIFVGALLLQPCNGFTSLYRQYGTRWTLSQRWDSSESNVIEFQQEGPSAEELDKIMYVLGLNMASQLPPDLRQLLTPHELRLAMQGVTDMMLGEAEDPMKQLQEYGDKVNIVVKERAEALMELAAAAGQKVLEDAAKDEGAKTTEGGVVVVPIEKGVGQYPTAASSVQVHYTGALTDGTVFDSSVQRGEPATFALKQVIRGWQEGLQEMQEGAKARLVIPSDLGYGPQGQPQAGIPGGAVLVFEVELIKVLSGGVGGLVL